MRSLIAALRSLTLPFGATSGARIVLNGVTGVIELYNAANTLILRLNPDSQFPATTAYNNVVLFNTAGVPIITLDSSPGAGARFRSTTTGDTGMIVAADGLTMIGLNVPGHHFAGHPGGLAMTGYSIFDDLILLKMSTGYPDDVALLGSTEWRLYSGKNDFSQVPFLQAVFPDLHASFGRPRIDLTGGGGTPGAQEARTVVNDIWYGTPNGSGGLLPTETASYPRGALTTKTVNADIGPTSGTTELVLATCDAVTLPAKRRIRIGVHIRSASSTVLGDVFTIRIKEGAQTLGETSWRAQTATTGVQGTDFWVVLDENYRPPSAGSHTYRVTATRVIGTGDFNIQGADTRPFQMIVEDIGGYV